MVFIIIKGISLDPKKETRENLFDWKTHVYSFGVLINCWYYFDGLVNEILSTLPKDIFFEKVMRPRVGSNHQPFG